MKKVNYEIFEDTTYNFPRGNDQASEKTPDLMPDPEIWQVMFCHLGQIKIIYRAGNPGKGGE